MQTAARRRGVLAGMLALAAPLALAGGAVAAPKLDFHPAATTRTATAPPFTVVAGHLNNPRGLAFGPTGALYVAEAGTGGTGPCIPSPEGGEPACYGPSGSVTRIAGGRAVRVVRGLPSLAGKDGSAATGPHDVSVHGGRLSIIVGLGANPADRRQLGPAGNRFGQLLSLRGKSAQRVDIALHELKYNPDHGAGAESPAAGIDSNPYAVADTGVARYVADAGANDLLRVDAKGRVRTVAVFPVQTAPAPAIPGFPVPPGTPIPVQSVPTSVVRGPDGALYVGELTGFPFAKGLARVWKVWPGKAPKLYASGFTNVIDLAFDRKGRLLVLEIAKNGLLDETSPGRLVRVGKGGHQETLLVDGLVAPSGLAVARSGAVYISNFGVFPGSDPRHAFPGTGQVIRFSPKG